MIRTATTLNIPIYTTTQNAARLGPTVSELATLLPEQYKTEIDKTAFSMMVPQLTELITRQASADPSQNKPYRPVSVLMVGIETHVCVTQTALDLLAMGHRVYLLVDGLSSCNAGERGIAIERLRREGCIVTTSESVMFELLGDAGSEHFKKVSGIIKEMKDETKAAVDTFCKL
ncbi:hypothetical protein BT93_L5817 [Corymbia citriodora subsp. variegata]|uniref:Isochorismatase-like domain-containing protein n=1 Tax=Corymbia citriodora subsp. variegata TaxID=360336 RepID=A0A8T0CIL6_CORYI|nr:hypothetical protein BT93_L5817 [Corymbia citriodora subsp. variegata]